MTLHFFHFSILSSVSYQIYLGNTVGFSGSKQHPKIEPMLTNLVSVHSYLDFIQPPKKQQTGFDRIGPVPFT